VCARRPRAGAAAPPRGRRPRGGGGRRGGGRPPPPPRGTATLDADREREQARSDAGVTAQLLSGYPIRFWDHWLGPRQRHLLVADLPDEPGDEPEWRDLAPDARAALEDGDFDVTPDGSTVVATWWRPVDDPRERVTDLVAIDVATGERRTVRAADRASHGALACSPDGARVVAERHPLGTPDAPPDRTLVLVDLATGEARDLLAGFDRWPQGPVWTADGTGVLFTADDDGHCRPFRVDVESGAVTRLAGDGAFTHLAPAWQGSDVWALCSGVDRQPAAVRLDARDARAPARVPSPGDDALPPGRVERVAASAAGGTRVPGWLVLPGEADGPAPLAVLIHGGPLNSWNAWHWRWNPHVLAARGWAVLLPDPALSTGYGLDFIRRGWGRWGAEPFTDILALLEAVAARDDVDGDRVAALGGSFGGYMANWMAGQTDRFGAIVTHASLWNLEAFHGTTDLGPWWEHQFGDRYRAPERYREWSPHRHVGRITTPTLVIHGERDFRVPYSEALMLVTDLARHRAPVAYLHFPDEHHWILKPQHVRIWYETVLAFCEHHVLGRPWEPPVLA
jgi:dipeptidyl aminopeptidase/acylaminoacyl peptidase